MRKTFIVGMMVEPNGDVDDEKKTLENGKTITQLLYRDANTP